jgi:hypothetical protein
MFKCYGREWINLAEVGNNLVGYFENSNEASGYIKCGEFLDWLKNEYFLETASAWCVESIEENQRIGLFLKIGVTFKGCYYSCCRRCRILCIRNFHINDIVYLSYSLFNDNVRNLGSLRLS